MASAEREDHSLINIFKKRPAKNAGGGEGARTSEQRQQSGELFWAVPKALQVKRWDGREGSFRGFDSPPGKF